MIPIFDAVVVGAGPAGMSCAVRLRKAGRHVLVIDDQPTPGGQIWRNIELSPLRQVLGPDYRDGDDVVASFRSSGAEYWPNTEVWQIDKGWTIHCRSDAGLRAARAANLVAACGAYERVVPFRGWTLPGVMTVGAAQILLKTSGQIPKNPVWILGAGPLSLLYARQLLAAGGKIAGILNTAPRRGKGAAFAHFPRAMRDWRELKKGIGWILDLRQAGIDIIRTVSRVEVRGLSSVEEIQFNTRRGVTVAPAEVVVVHDGLLPQLHMPASVGAQPVWNNASFSFAAQTDKYGRSEIRNLYISGDAAGIGGARAAVLSGTICAEAIEAELAGHSDNRLAGTVRQLLKKRVRALAVRPFLDAFFRPSTDMAAIADDVVVCRCEEITAGEIRKACIDAAGPDAVKLRTRAGMGMCQGRQCSYILTALLADRSGKTQSDIGLFSVRPPLKPVTLGELAVSSNEGIAS